jgi:hypothetical protein
MDITTLPRYSKTLTRTAGGREHQVRMVLHKDGYPVLQRRADGELHRSAKNYRVTSPFVIANRLEQAGFEVTQCVGLWSHARGARISDRRASPWRHGLEVAFPAGGLVPVAGGDIYRSRARILLANTGRDSLKIALGALRLACTNQFTSCVLSMRHTDAAIDQFIEDPASVLLGLRDLAETTPLRLEALRGVPVPEAYYTAVYKFPRVATLVERELIRKYTEGDFWALAQALTGSRQPRAIRASMALLQPDFLAMVEEQKGAGLLPSGEYFDTWRPRQDKVGHLNHAPINS